MPFVKICSALSSCAVCVTICMCSFNTLTKVCTKDAEIQESEFTKSFDFSLKHKKKNRKPAKNCGVMAVGQEEAQLCFLSGLA